MAEERRLSPAITPYNITRKFRIGSNLHVYLSFKEPDMISMETRDCTLFTALSALKKIISRERLYDGRNTTCIICSPDLEIALGMKFLHVTEVKDVVLTQMEYLPPIKLPMMPPTASQPATERPQI